MGSGAMQAVCDRACGDEADAPLQAFADASPAAKLYQRCLERSARFRAQPPGANRDGIHAFTTK